MAHRAKGSWLPGEKPKPCEFTHEEIAEFRNEWNTWYHRYKTGLWRARLKTMLGREPTQAEIEHNPEWKNVRRKTKGRSTSVTFNSSDFHLDFDAVMADLLGLRPKIDDGSFRIYVVTSQGEMLMSKYSDHNGQFIKMSPDYRLFKGARVAPESRYDKHYPGRRRGVGVTHAFTSAVTRVRTPEGIMFECIDTEIKPSVTLRFNTRYDSYNGESAYGPHWFVVPTVAKWRKPKKKRKPRMVNCKKCDGVGWKPTKLSIVQCEDCEGQGKVKFLGTKKNG